MFYVFISIAVQIPPVFVKLELFLTASSREVFHSDDIGCEVLFVGSLKLMEVQSSPVKTE